LTFSSADGSVSGTPSTAASAATYTVTITDQAGQIASNTFSLTVTPPALTTTLAISSVSLYANVLATPFTPVTTEGGYGSNVFTVSPSLPTGLSLNPSTGEITGTPTQSVVNQNHTITVTDSENQTSQKTFALTVETAPALSTSLNEPTVTLIRFVDSAFVSPVSASGGVGTIAFTVTPALPLD
jgi:hypothetical protein